MRHRILDIIYKSIIFINNTYEKKRGELPLSEDTKLIGREAMLDSLGFVTLIIDIEQRILNELGIDLVITNERAMSLEHSPFLTVGTLVDYTTSLIEELQKV